MKTLHIPIFLFLPLIVLVVFRPVPTVIEQETSISPTPTYDPLVEPPLPEHPTEYELGRDLYWHWCMTCHGDRGQGLTDEFRGIWEPEHQNCWARGCHTGRSSDGGFPIPTVVPAIVDETHLAKFASVQTLSDFLEGTHPPQNPGILKGDEYHAIALFVFTMNERSLIEIPSTITPAFLPTETANSSPHPESRGEFVAVSIIILFSMFAALFFIFIVTRGRDGAKDKRS